MRHSEPIDIMKINSSSTTKNYQTNWRQKLDFAIFLKVCSTLADCSQVHVHTSWLCHLCRSDTVHNVCVPAIDGKSWDVIGQYEFDRRGQKKTILSKEYNLEMSHIAWVWGSHLQQFDWHILSTIDRNWLPGKMFACAASKTLQTRGKKMTWVPAGNHCLSPVKSMNMI